MPSKLVIVESPAKGRTIERYLGSDYKVVACFGHIRDLPKHELGVDTEHNFKPVYIIPIKSRKTISNLKNEIKSVQEIYLATDYDREGEAIAWHILQACGLKKVKSEKLKVKSQPNIYRITFHEITKPALENAIKNPREIDQDLVDAQQARRVLDRLVGYKLSPFLWKKVVKGLSAGRVQSVAIRLIVDREREIEKFIPAEYWSIEGEFDVDNNKLKGNLTQFKGEKIEKLTIKNKKVVEEIEKKLKDDTYVVSSLKEAEELRSPFAPYTTSTLQQDANRRLECSSKQTMRLSQDLYEDGLITYMRTDSTNVAAIAQSSARKWIAENFGDDYLPPSPVQYKTKVKGAQEAHEAVRPTNPAIQVDNIKGDWSDKHKKMYQLIWQRFIASQMKSAKLSRATILIDGSKNSSQFTVNGQKIVFAGYMKVYPVQITENILPSVKEKSSAKLNNLLSEEHFTQPPARYTEASLVKELEQLGIGRPSTYAPTISTIIDRGYTKVEKRVFYPQEIGMVVTDLLKEHFPDIVDVGFTAKMEENLDQIADGKLEWTKPLHSFWVEFSKLLDEKYQQVDKKKLVKEIEEDCPQCKKKLVERLGKFGKFIACSGFPKCKYSRQIIVDTGIECPECHKATLVERKTRKSGKVFWGCATFPRCKYATWDNPVQNVKT